MFLLFGEVVLNVIYPLWYPQFDRLIAYFQSQYLENPKILRITRLTGVRFNRTFHCPKHRPRLLQVLEHRPHHGPQHILMLLNRLPGLYLAYLSYFLSTNWVQFEPGMETLTNPGKLAQSHWMIHPWIVRGWVVAPSKYVGYGNTDFIITCQSCDPKYVWGNQGGVDHIQIYDGWLIRFVRSTSHAAHAAHAACNGESASESPLRRILGRQNVF